MVRSNHALARAGRTAAYGVLGAAGTAATAVLLLAATRPVQDVVYRAVYLPLGPADATQTAVLVQFLGVSVLALALPTFLADYLSTRLANTRPLATALVALLGALVVFLAFALAGLAALPTALAVLLVAAVTLLLVLRYRYDVRSGGLPAFAGGVPVTVLLLLLAGAGLGWGWGYVVTAQEVPAAAVDGTPVSLHDAPFTADLFTADTCSTTDGDRTCILELRGYTHETATARWLAAHGVYCPRSGTSTNTILVRHDGTYYRLGCAAHGD